jgi:hypothetical protein
MRLAIGRVYARLGVSLSAPSASVQAAARKCRTLRSTCRRFRRLARGDYLSKEGRRRCSAPARGTRSVNSRAHSG